jgi:hypothetical protein
MRDKWGLPRRWRCWRDPLFWIFSVIAVATGLPLCLVVYQASNRSLLSLDGLLIVLAGLAIYASVYWVLYDSYRWEHPQRWWWLFLLLLIWAAALPYYMMKRKLWFHELFARRNKPI